MTKQIPWDKRPLVRPYEALALIHMGFDPDRATDYGVRAEVWIPEKIFGQAQSDMILFNGGGEIIINVPLDGKGDTSFHNFMYLPTFGIYSTTLDIPHREPWGPVFCIRALNVNDETNKIPGPFFRADEINVRDHDYIASYDISLMDKEGKTKFEIELIPFGVEDDNVKHSDCVVPFLPFEQRDAKYWTKVSQMFGLTLGEARTERDDINPEVSYEVQTNNPKIKSLRFSSFPKTQGNHRDGDLYIEAEFGKEVGAVLFREFYRWRRGMTRMTLTNKSGELSLCGSDTLDHDDFKGRGRRLLAEIPKGRNYLATGLIQRIAGI